MCIERTQLFHVTTITVFELIDTTSCINKLSNTRNFTSGYSLPSSQEIVSLVSAHEGQIKE